jgi:hypothetical protein
MNDLDLSPLATAPVAPLAEASAVRARGVQRRQRTRAALAGAAALVVLAGAGTAIALGSVSRPQSLQTADPTPTGTPEQMDVVLLPPPYEALVQPPQAAEVDPRAWHPLSVHSDAVALLQPCATADVHGSSGAVGQLTDGAGKTVAQQVLRYRSPADAATAHAAVESDVRRCPQRPADSDSGTGYARTSLFALTGGALGVALTQADCTTCDAATGYWAVVVVGPYVGYLEADRATLQAWADAMTVRLTQCSSEAGCPPDQGAALPADYMLDVGDVDRITGQQWSALLTKEASDVPLQPCSAPAQPFDAGLSVRFELGGTDVASTVGRRTQAVDGLAAIRTEVQTCPQRDGGATSGTSTRSYALLEQPADDAVLVQDTYRDCDACREQVVLWVVVAKGDLVSFTVLPGSELKHAAAWAAAMRSHLG